MSASDDEQRTWARMMATPNLVVCLAEFDDDVVGTATLMTMPNVTYACAPTAFIEAVVVAHQYRRQGIATACSTSGSTYSASPRPCRRPATVRPTVRHRTRVVTGG